MNNEQNTESNLDRAEGGLQNKISELKDVVTKLDVPKKLAGAARSTASFTREHWLPITIGVAGIAALALTIRFLRAR